MKKLAEIKKEWLAPKEIIDILGLAKSTAYELIGSGAFITCRVRKPWMKRGRIRVQTASVRHYLERQISLYEFEEGILREKESGKSGESGESLTD